jgi:hypothetical protein
VDVLKQAIEQTGSKFIVIDPLMAHLSASLNGWNDQEIRRALSPLAQLAEAMQVAILVIAHLNKDSKKEAIDRIGGSVGISNAARSVLFVGPDPDDPDGPIRMLAHPKCNVGAQQPTLRYHTETVLLSNGPESIETIKIVWDGEAPGITAADLVARPDPVTREDRSHAVDWLEQALPLGQERKQADIEHDAKQAGVSFYALKKAKAELHVKSRKTGYQGTWYWRREAPLYETHDSTSLDKNTSKSLKNPKGCKEVEVSPFEAPFDLFEDPKKSNNSALDLFDDSLDISTTYILSTPKEVDGVSYGEARGAAAPQGESASKNGG